MTSMDPKDALLLATTHDSPMSSCRLAGLKEHPLAPRDMWLAAVNAGSNEGYWEWAEQVLAGAWAEMQKTLPPVHATKMVLSPALRKQLKTCVVAPTFEDYQQLIKGDLE